MNTDSDRIWDAITDGAKTKIDYAAFEKFFDGLGGVTLPDNVLFSIIVGYTAGKSDEELVQQIEDEFLKIGCVASDEEIRWLLKDKSVALKQEIMATDLAASLLDQGWDKDNVLLQIKKFLSV